jgi:hypothetical protein
MYAIGVDPGLSGALAVIDHAGTLVALADTPTLTLWVARGARHDYDVPGMVALVAPYAGGTGATGPSPGEFDGSSGVVGPEHGRV